MCPLRGTDCFSLYPRQALSAPVCMPSVKPSVPLYVCLPSSPQCPCMYAFRHSDFITSRYIELKLNGGFLTAILSQNRTFSCWSRHLFSRRQQRHPAQCNPSAALCSSNRLGAHIFYLSRFWKRNVSFYQARGKQAEVINAGLLLHNLCWPTLLQGVSVIVSPNRVTLSLTKPTWQSHPVIAAALRETIKRRKDICELFRPFDPITATCRR